MLLSEVDGRVKVKEDYFIQVEDGPFLMLVVGMDASKPLAQFDHANLLARKYEVHEYKHYHPKRGKWWSAQAGVNLYFAVPKENIELILEKGYSFPQIKIGGKTITLNVSGGTALWDDIINGRDIQDDNSYWTDVIHSTSSTLTNCGKAVLKAIADNAMSIGDVKRLGISLNWKTEENSKYLLELIAKPLVQKDLKVGKFIVLSKYCSFDGSHGPFKIVSKGYRQQHFYVDSGYYNNGAIVYYKHVDWLETAKANNLKIPTPIDMNRILPS